MPGNVKVSIDDNGLDRKLRIMALQSSEGGKKLTQDLANYTKRRMKAHVPKKTRDLEASIKRFPPRGVEEAIGERGSGFGGRKVYQVTVIPTADYAYDVDQGTKEIRPTHGNVLALLGSPGKEENPTRKTGLFAKNGKPIMRTIYRSRQPIFTRYAKGQKGKNFVAKTEADANAYADVLVQRFMARMRAS